MSPRYDEFRTDIIQTLELKTKDNLVSFTQGIQQTSPIDSFVHVLPAPMLGIHLMKLWLLVALHKVVR